MTPEEQTRIRQFNETLGETMSLQVYLPDDARAEQLNAFCKRLTKLAPKISISDAIDADGDLPALLIGSNLIYHAVPSGPELEPFLMALSHLNANHSEFDASSIGDLENILPAELKMYIAPTCPFCPGILQQLVPLPFMVPSIRLTVTDGMLFSELAEQDDIRSVPTVILDDAFRWSGQMNQSEIIEALTHRNPSNLKRSTLQHLLLDEEEGAYRLAAMMNSQRMIFPAFFDLLLDETFTTRLAAMVVMETLTEENPGLAGTALNPLMERFDAVVDPVKGDLLYILGELKSDQAVPFIEKVLEGDYAEEVKESAREALEELKDET